MRHPISVVILLAVTGSCFAGTITKGSINHGVAVRDNCTSASSDTTVRCSLTTSLEADLSTTEVAGFSPDTVIRGGFPLGPTSSFRLSDDPKYEAGDTSARISTRTVFNNILWKRTISMRWDDGKLRLSAKVSAKQKLLNFAPIEWNNPIKSSTSSMSTSGTLVTLLGSSSGAGEFLNLSATVLTTVETSKMFGPRLKGRITRFDSKQSIKGGTLLP